MNTWLRLREEESRKAYNALMKFYPFTLDDLDGEIWREVNGYEGYQVSNFGRVKSFKCKTPRIMVPMLNSHGYLRVSFFKKGKEKKFLIHVLVARLYVQNANGKPEVNHIDGHPLNCHFSNLEWATHAENMTHASKLGLTPKGEQRPDTKLTDKQVAQIRANPNNLSVHELAKLFGVSPSTISVAQTGKFYRSVEGQIRKSLRQPVSSEIKNKILAEYIKGKRGAGCRSLAKKFGVSHETVRKIVNGK